MKLDRTLRDLPDVVNHYRAGGEGERLSHGPGELERLRTEEVLSRSFPNPPARILDVGGGPGTYVLSLLDRGFDVHLIDLVPEHVTDAGRLFEERGHTGRASVGDARELDVESESRDAVLLLGPLYHLLEREDRLRALGEARRVVRPGGHVYVAAISRYASVLDGFARGLVRDPEYVSMMLEDIRTGRHKNPPGKDYFTTAYFHTPDEFTAEIRDSGLDLLNVVGVEGPFWCLSDFRGRWEDMATRQLMLSTLRDLESESWVLSMSAHLLATAWRP
ncbi:MAG: class I SAM-dependent methyltransferase [Gemmatimonadota bacterium]